VSHLHVIVEADGGSRGNPGPAGYGVQIVDDSGDVVAELHQSLGQATNNVAEYQGLLAALAWALEHGLHSLHVRHGSRRPPGQAALSFRAISTRQTSGPLSR